MFPAAELCVVFLQGLFLPLNEREGLRGLSEEPETAAMSCLSSYSCWVEESFLFPQTSEPTVAAECCVCGGGVGEMCMMCVYVYIWSVCVCVCE